MIHKIDKIIRVNEKFYILDRKQKSVLVFNHEGGFMKKFSQVGNGPGEYKYLQDFEINRFTNNIELLEPWGVINVYDSLGNFVEKYRLPSSVQSAHYFTRLNSDTIAIYSTIESNRLTIFSKKQDKVIKQFHEIPQWVNL